MGHNLYREWSDYWPKQGEDVPFSAFINGLPKYVLSHDDFTADWNNTTIVTGPDDASVAEQVRALKDQVDGDLGMSGCATTVRWLIGQGLLDELALLVHPIAVAKGQRLFEGTGTVPLRLLSQRHPADRGAAPALRPGERRGRGLITSSCAHAESHSSCPTLSLRARGPQTPAR